MNVLALLFYYSSANENDGYHSHNESLIPDERHSFYTFDSCFMLIENDDLNIDQFITNYKCINHVSNSNQGAKMSNIEDYLYDNTNKFIVVRSSENFQQLKLLLPIQTIVYETEAIVRKNVGKKTENERFQVLSQISESNTTSVNILFLVIHEDIADPNWHISFIILTKKGIQHFGLTLIL